MDPNRFLRRASGLLVPRMELAYEPWKFSPCASCCLEECPDVCTGCLNRVYPAGLTITIAGIVNAACDCTPLNGSWYLPYDECNINPAGTHTAEYHSVFPLVWDCFETSVGIFCDVVWICDDEGDNTRKIEVRVTGVAAPTRVWRVTETGADLAAYDCEAFVNKNLPLVTNPAWFCNFSSATCLVNSP